MYRYNHFDQHIVDQRVGQFKEQIERHLSGELSDDDLKPWRLQNGLYIQRHGPMHRIAIPYGVLASFQLRKLAFISEHYDRGFGHFTTRHNMQFNWPKLEAIPDILAELSTVQMHAIQTSGNCIRNVSTDHLAGVAPDELTDPRPWCEVIRQWSTFHPEFAFLPRKFKIAVGAATHDRAVLRAHDIGLEITHIDDNGPVFRVYVGGGLGRTPILGEVLREDLPWQHLLSYIDAVLRVYNSHGRRDNIYKARIKILVQALGIEEFGKQVAEEWVHLKDDLSTLTKEEIERISHDFTPPDYETNLDLTEFEAQLADNPSFAAWVKRNTHAHKVAGYAAVTLSLKATGNPPGDITTAQMLQASNLADDYSFGLLRVSHEQNLLLVDVKKTDLFALWQDAKKAGLATANIGMITDIICCPGGDLCALALARSIPIAEAIQQRFEDLDYLYDVGEVALNISGCINSCGHHHVAQIGVLGIDKNGEEWYQVTLGGTQGLGSAETRIGKVIGPSFTADEVPDVVEALVHAYLDLRTDGENFFETFLRLGMAPFKERAYQGRDKTLPGHKNKEGVLNA